MTDPVVVLNKLASIGDEHAKLSSAGNEYFFEHGEYFKGSVRMYAEHVRNHCNELIEELDK